MIEGKKFDTNEMLPIIGIGASEAGMEALLIFLKNVPENSGLAFVIIQDREHIQDNTLLKLIQSSTNMKVIEVTDGTTIEPNSVYIILQKKNVSLENNVLYLSDYIGSSMMSSPIDFFFRSYSKDQEENGIGVLLSTVGNDGISGVRDIREKGGVVFVREPILSDYGSIPHTFIEANIADIVTTADKIPSKIISYLEYRNLSNIADEAEEDKRISYLDHIIFLLQSQTGHDFSSYKNSTVQRRIERRMVIHQIDKVETYVRLLEENPHEIGVLFNELLIGVTSFFREPMEWELLKEKVIPELMIERVPNDTFRAWVSGCSTGEEAYSLAIILDEVLSDIKYTQKSISVQIFATDLDNEAINKAREGIYSENIAEQMSTERLNRYFIKVDRGYQVVKPIRNMVIFAQQNMIKDPPFTKLDLLTCRNVLIYLKIEMQKKLIPLYHYSLKPGGFLFLGSAEAVGGFTDLFKSLDRKSRIYRRLQPLLQSEHVEFPTTYIPLQPIVRQTAPVAHNIQSLADRLILQYYSPATVLVNCKGDILYITGRTGKYLEPAAGNADWNILSMAREGLYHKLNNAFYKAINKKEEVIIKNTIVINEGGSQIVNISIKPISEPDEMSGMVMIAFTDVENTNKEDTKHKIHATKNNEREIELERELIQTRQKLQVTSTEMQLSKEEFKSSNEELQSTNEELQSTNEELATTKEEVQSLNDQLKSMNFELQDKLEELLIATNDMKNKMDSMKIATLFLDNMLCVRHFTSQMSEISRLISSDVGRPITDITSDLNYPGLTEDVSKVLRTLKTEEKEIKSNNGLWFNISILPYHTLEDTIDGVVITFINITKYKIMEEELRKQNTELEYQLKGLGQAADSIANSTNDGKDEVAASSN